MTHSPHCYCADCAVDRLDGIALKLAERERDARRHGHADAAEAYAASRRNAEATAQAIALRALRGVN